MATLVPNGNLRIAAMNDPGRTASADELHHMKMLLDEGLEAGAFGMSLGLEYSAESASTSDELEMLARQTGERGCLLAVHTANKDGNTFN